MGESQVPSTKLDARFAKYDKDFTAAKAPLLCKWSDVPLSPGVFTSPLGLGVAPTPNSSSFPASSPPGMSPKLRSPFDTPSCWGTPDQFQSLLRQAIIPGGEEPLSLPHVSQAPQPLDH